MNEEKSFNALPLQVSFLFVFFLFCCFFFHARDCVNRIDISRLFFIEFSNDILDKTKNYKYQDRLALKAVFVSQICLPALYTQIFCKLERDIVLPLRTFTAIVRPSLNCTRVPLILPSNTSTPGESLRTALCTFPNAPRPSSSSKVTCSGQTSKF